MIRGNSPVKSGVAPGFFLSNEKSAERKNPFARKNYL